MCGIAGIVSYSGAPDADAVRCMVRTMGHRGPDHCAIVERPHVALGHARLAVIDLDAASNQPMHDPESGLWIVYNGELYNFAEVRRELESRGHVFRSRGDTEVVLRAFRTWGADCLSHFVGMFAFAVWSERERRLFLARDRAGEKPLYYTAVPDWGIAFASDLNGLMACPSVPRRLNLAALGHYLAQNHILTNECILQGVDKVPPAHFVRFDWKKTPTRAEYWDYSRSFAEKTTTTEAQAAEQLRAAVDEAVRGQEISDVPLGVFLSGGLDSATIAASMAQMHPPQDITAFTVGFGQPRFDESGEARATARALGVSLANEVLNDSCITVLPKIVETTGEPLADVSMIPMFHLSRFARERATVCLSGDGGDEVFGGYPTYLADRIHCATSRIPRSVFRVLHRISDIALPVGTSKLSLDDKIRRLLGGLSRPYAEAHCAWRQIFSPAEVQALVHPELLPSVREGDPIDVFAKHFSRVAHCHPLDQAMYVDAKTFMVDSVLAKVDRMSMAHSLEVRAPFLDHRIMEFGAALPAAWKARWGTSKYLLRRSQECRLPKDVRRRAKAGFAAPLGAWLRGELRELAVDATHSRRMHELFRSDAIDRLWHQHLNLIRDNGLRLFGLACLGLWLEHALTPASNRLNSSDTARPDLARAAR